MIALATGAEVPIRTLAQTSRNGSGRFEIARVSGLTSIQKDLFFVPHRKDFYLLAFPRNGTARHWVDGVPYSFRPDTLYFSTPQQVFLKEDGMFEATSICFTPEFLDLATPGNAAPLSLLQNRHNGHALRLAPEDVRFTDDLCDKMLHEQQGDQRHREPMLQAYLRVMLLYLSRLYDAQFAGDDAPADRALLRRFQALVGAHFAETHEVARYAAMLHVSAGHLGEQIRQQSGKTPIEHIHDRVLLEAKRLLFHTGASAKEIAFGLGFEDASYFTRFFRRLTGSTPMAYRAATREKYQ